MLLIGMIFLSLLGHAKKTPSNLDHMERLSTGIKERSASLNMLFDTPTQESIPMLEIESSMMEMENLVMQLETHLSTLPPPSL